jgi:hypothetical protein
MPTTPPEVANASPEVRKAAAVLIAKKLRLPKLLKELDEVTALILSEPKSKPIKRRKI